MLLRNALLGLALSLPLLAVGCAVDSSATGEDEASTDSAISGTQEIGSQFQTTARLNFREGPSTDDDIIRTLPLGAVVTILDGEPVNGFYNVQNGSDTGYVYGAYLKSGARKLPTKAPIGVGNGEDDGNDSAASDQPGSDLSPTGQIQTCKASFYTSGQRTADGESFNTNALTAAHKTLPFNTIVKVTNTANGKSVNVRINDRGPFVSGRCIDLSRAAFTSIGSTSAGVLSVKIETLR